MGAANFLPGKSKSVGRIAKVLPMKFKFRGKNLPNRWEEICVDLSGSPQTGREVFFPDPGNYAKRPSHSMCSQTSTYVLVDKYVLDPQQVRTSSPTCRMCCSTSTYVFFISRLMGG